jgi:hypothetical protein
MFLNRSHCQRVSVTFDAIDIRREPKATECPACLHCGRELMIAPCLPQPIQPRNSLGLKMLGNLQ